MVTNANNQTIHAGRRIRVLVAAPSLDIYGGQALMAARLIERLREEPILEVAFQPHNPRLPRGFGWLQRIKYVRTLATVVAYFVMLAGRAWRYDIIHIFTASYYSYLLSAVPALLVAKAYGKRTILNYRSGEAEDHLKGWPCAVRTCRWADRIVVPSGYLVDVFARFGLRAEAIFNTIEIDRFRFRERRPLRPRFVSARLLEPLYNVACALRAFALVQGRYPDAQLVIAADGSERNKLGQLARELNLQHTSFIGKIDYQRVPGLLDASDIYLNANDLDNMPSSLIECMAAGVAVVSTNAGGIPYVVTNEQTGLLVACNDHEAMAHAAIRLLEDEAMATAISRRARREAEKYQWSAVRDEWLGLYQQLAGASAAVLSRADATPSL
jgi:glycosyltransferase involved in cell wall biosynthesis